MRSVAEAADVLAAEGLAGLPGALSLPCRLALVPVSGPAPSAGPGFVVRRGRTAYVLAGPAAALRAGADAVLAAALDAYDRPAPAIRFADGGAWAFEERTRILGIVNVTPDSFSDGGRFDTKDRAVERALALLEEGADAIDVGGESTRPGAAPVAPADEEHRVVPVIDALRRAAPGARISVDTRRAVVARAALDAGADMVNDVTALADPDMAPAVSRAGVPVALMHMRGTPATMQSDTHYDDIVGEVMAYLAERAAFARSAGIPGDRILADPGLGFGKSARGNERLLLQLRSLTGLGVPLLVGASRKAFLGRASGIAVPSAREAASVAAAVVAALEGAAVVRVHDVAATRQALAVLASLRKTRAELAGADTGTDGTRRLAGDDRG